MSDVVVVGTIGNPGQKESATFSPLERGDRIDVGAVVAKELDELNPVQKGYHEDMIKYNNQIKRMNND